MFFPKPRLMPESLLGSLPRPLVPGSLPNSQHEKPSTLNFSPDVFATLPSSQIGRRPNATPPRSRPHVPADFVFGIYFFLGWTPLDDTGLPQNHISPKGCCHRHRETSREREDSPSSPFSCLFYFIFPFKHRSLTPV